MSREDQEIIELESEIRDLDEKLRWIGDRVILYPENLSVDAVWDKGEGRIGNVRFIQFSDWLDNMMGVFDG